MEDIKHVAVSYATNSRQIQNAFEKVMHIFGWQVISLACGDRPVGGDIKDKWIFEYTWPLCKLDSIQNGCVLCLAAVSDDGRGWNNTIMHLVRLHLLKKLRNNDELIHIAIVSSDHLREFCTSFNSFGIDTLSYDILDIIQYLSNPPSYSDKEVFSAIPSIDMYKASLLRLTHQIKNGWLLTGTAARNNQRLIEQLFQSIQNDFSVLGESTGKELCARSIKALNNNENLESVIKGWEGFYNACNDSYCKCKEEVLFGTLDGF